MCPMSRQWTCRIGSLSSQEVTDELGLGPVEHTEPVSYTPEAAAAIF